MSGPLAIMPPCAVGEWIRLRVDVRDRLNPGIMGLLHRQTFRVRYAETDQMGALNSPRALEWFEFGRTEWLRAADVSYCQMEHDGMFLPVVEANCRYQRRVKFDDPIVLTTYLGQIGRASIRFDYRACLHGSQDNNRVLTGWTTHAFVDGQGNVTRPPSELIHRLRDLVHEDSAENGS
jgi:acyl-CoA thioester hydrolase